VTHNSGLLPDKLSGGEYAEVRDATYAEPCGELLVPIGVDLEDEGLARHILCSARHLWSGGATRAAPVSPDIDKDRTARVLNDFVE
jgi:hypothetical protein